MLQETTTGFFDNEYLRNSCFCPLCKARAPKVSVRFLEGNEGIHFAHLHCKLCKVGTMVLHYVGPLGVNSVGILTDLGFEEARKVFQKPPVAIDEVIECYRILEEERTHINKKKQELYDNHSRTSHERS